jgi:hypothetical protein
MADTGYYEESYPPSILNFSTGATAGIPGSFTPAGSRVPKSVTDLAQGNPVDVLANPLTPWTTGQFVQTGTAGPAGRATWTGTNWASGAAPLQAESEPEPIVFAAIPVETPPETPPEESSP